MAGSVFTEHKRNPLLSESLRDLLLPHRLRSVAFVADVGTVVPNNMLIKPTSEIATEGELALSIPATLLASADDVVG